MPDGGHVNPSRSSIPTIRVDRDRHGGWEVAVPESDAHVSCQTFDDARRIALLRAARRRPCELVVRDAYHRVIQHELIGDGAETSELHGHPGRG